MATPTAPAPGVCYPASPGRSLKNFAGFFPLKSTRRQHCVILFLSQNYLDLKNACSRALVFLCVRRRRWAMAMGDGQWHEETSIIKRGALKPNSLPMNFSGGSIPKPPRFFNALSALSSSTSKVAQPSNQLRVLGF